VKRLSLRVLLISGGAVVAALAAVAGWAWWTLTRPYQGFEGQEAQIVIEPGTGVRAILEDLEEGGILANADLAWAYLVYGLEDPPLKAGEYLFRGTRNTPQVLRRLIAGEVITHPVTLIEGLTLEETARTLTEAGFGRFEAFAEAMSSPGLILDLDPAAENLEGYLFPDTYNFARNTPEADIVRTLARTFRDRFQRQVVPDLAEGRGVRDLVILASIVEREAMLDAERPLIAAVFANRLQRGRRLDADPTIIYALKLEGHWDGNLRRRHLSLDSPYNTYLHTGLPPSPICSPGLASLAAAANPADVGYFYFVSRNDGSHVFAETLAEHNRNVERWQKRYWRERWARERAARAD
jgi:UPF0755 protein